jgi:hypothetical protein
MLFMAVISGHDGAEAVPRFRARAAIVSLSQADSPGIRLRV